MLFRGLNLVFFFLKFTALNPLRFASSTPTSQFVQENNTRATEDPEFTCNKSGLKNYVYFANWDIYGRSYHIQQLPASNITHVLYAFWNISTDGTVFSDFTKRYPTDSSYDVGKNLYGSLKQLYILKKHNRQLKTLMSIGGWTYSSNFSAAASTNSTRSKFASDVVTYVQDLGFDGVDIDWEYPDDETQAGNFVLLLAEVRKKLDQYAEIHAPGYHFLLTVACPAGSSHYQKMHLSAMNAYIDTWNLMSYDYSGAWDTRVGHDANLYPSSSNMPSTPYNTQRTVSDYISAGVPASKIVLGIPLYGRAFLGTNGLGQPFNGVGPGSWEKGIWDYKVLPKPGATEEIDDETVASYSYDASTQTLISYDNVEVVKRKAEYVQSQGLAGAMFWEASGDRNDSQSLIGTTAGAFGTLDETQNYLNYPASQYMNVVAGMTGE